MKTILLVVVMATMTGCAGQDVVANSCAVRAGAISTLAKVNATKPLSKKSQDEISAAIADTHDACTAGIEPTRGSMEKALFDAGIARLETFLLTKE